MILSFTIQSCNNNNETVLFYKPKGNNEQKIDPSIPISILSNTIITSNYKENIFPICFEAAFMDSTYVKEITDRGEQVYTFQTINIGKIKIESGNIIACDPSFMYDGSVFTDKFPIGDFKVQLAVAKIPENNNRVAFSRILFSNNPVCKWVYATRKGEKKVPINDTTLYCFSVDGGMGLYIDKIARDKFITYDQSEFKKVFIDEMYKEGNSYGFIHNFETYNLATFSTGYGDGCYGSFIGLDKNNKICKLVSDLGILMWWKK